MKRPFISAFTGFTGSLMAGLLLGPTAAIADENNQTPLQQGKSLTIEYCQACHYFEGSNQAGTVGPPFVAMKPRFPERQKLHSVIYDPQVASKPHSMMPPFGRHGLLSDDEIRLIMDYLYTL